MEHEILILAFLALGIAGIAWWMGYNYGVANETAVQERLAEMNLPRCHEVNVPSDLEALGLDTTLLKLANWESICQNQLKARGGALKNCTDYAKSLGLGV